MTDPTAIATLLDSLATALETGFPAHVSREKYLAEIAAALAKTPLVHPLRMVAITRPEPEEHVCVPWDAVFEMSRAIQRGKATPDEIRAFAVKLREGEAEMRLTGWGWRLR
jgi:hypothetical protein